MNEIFQVEVTSGTYERLFNVRAATASDAKFKALKRAQDEDGIDLWRPAQAQVLDYSEKSKEFSRKKEADSPFNALKEYGQCPPCRCPEGYVDRQGCHQVDCQAGHFLRRFQHVYELERGLDRDH